MSEPEEPTEDTTAPVKSTKLPKGTYFLLAQTFPVTLGVFSTQSIYALYVRNKLKFGTDATVAIIHGIKTMISVFFPIGALISSSFANRFVILIIGDIWQALARILLFVGSFPPLHDYALKLTLAYWVVHSCGMVIMAGVFPAFEGDQFKLPEEHDVLVRYYHIDYIFRSVSVLLAYSLLPLLKSEIPCLGDQECFPIPFGVSILSYTLEVTLLLAGTKYYIIKKPTKNIASNVWNCVKYAVRTWKRERKTNPVPHWLDYSEPVYGADMVSDVKTYFRILLIFVTLPMFYAIFNQVNTKWVFQATRMNGRVGSYTIIPDHFLLLNPLLVLIFMPLTMNFVDPYIRRWGMDRTLRRMAFGGASLALAFMVSGFLESHIKSKNPETVHSTPNEGYLRIFNGLNCSFKVHPSDFFDRDIELSALSMYTVRHIPIQGYKTFTISSKDPCANFENKTVYLEEQRAVTIFISKNQEDSDIEVTAYEEADKAESGYPQLTVLGADMREEIIVRDSNEINVDVQIRPRFVDEIYPRSQRPRVVEVVPDTYTLVRRGNEEISRFHMYLGGAYAILLHENMATIYETRPPNSVHILWLFPQAIIFSIGEIYFMIALQDFKYSEGPMSMKSVVCATAEFCEGLGDAIIVLVTYFGTLDQDHEFFMFSALLILDMGLLIMVALHFKPQDPNTKLI